MEEEWRNINGYEGLYLISNFGKVLSLTTKKIRITNVNKRGYEQLSLCRDGIIQTHRIHRLVAIAFIPNPENKEQVNHKDGNKLNNHHTNLEWNTNQENRTHAVVNNLISKGPTIWGENHGRAKLTENEIIEIRKLFSTGLYTKEYLANKFGVSRVNIFKIINRKIWTHI